MTARRPVCGNDPRAELTDGDRAAVAEFREYLRLRKAAEEALPAALATVTEEEWLVFGYDADAWGRVTSTSATMAEAEDKRSKLAVRYPSLMPRVVRKTTTSTYTEEAQR